MSQRKVSGNGAGTTSPGRSSRVSTSGDGGQFESTPRTGGLVSSAKWTRDWT